MNHADLRTFSQTVFNLECKQYLTEHRSTFVRQTNVTQDRTCECCNCVYRMCYSFKDVICIEASMCALLASPTFICIMSSRIDFISSKVCNPIFTISCSTLIRWQDSCSYKIKSSALTSCKTFALSELALHLNQPSAWELTLPTWTIQSQTRIMLDCP